MKKLLLILFGTMWLSGQVAAQFEKGTRHWGTTIDFSGENSQIDNIPNQEFTSNSFFLNPSVQTGWVFADNRMFGLRAGANLAWYKAESKSPGSTDYVNTSFGTTYQLSPFLRHYKPLTSRLAIFLHSGLDLAYIRVGNKVDILDYKSNAYSAGISVVPGITFSISPRFSLEADVNLLSLGVSYTAGDEDNYFNFNAGIRTSIQQSFGLRAAWYIH